MSHYKTYPAYKDSGVEWLGKVPEHWAQVPLKWIFDCLDGKRIPLNAEQRAEIPGDIPYWGSGGIIGHISQHLFDENLILLGEDGAPFFDKNRPVAFEITGKSWINNHIHVLKLIRDISISWFVHYLNSVEYRLYIDGSTRDKLTQEDMKKIVLLLPPKDEVHQALERLNYETTRIDTLIAKKTRFIELLKEKRQALITQAVTKGLNPNVKMKDSGVEWLGEVPEHWGVMQLQYVIAKIEQGWSPECLGEPAQGAEWGIVKSGCVNGGIFSPTENKKLPGNLEPKPEIAIHTGDILMSRASGSSELIGSVGMVEDFNGNLMLSDKIFRIIINNIIQHYFFILLMSSSLIRSQIEIAISGAEGLANNLPQARIKKFWFALPPLKDQAIISDQVKEQTKRIDALTSKTQLSITLLKERRSALITAAVTGQIDLREAA